LVARSSVSGLALRVIEQSQVQLLFRSKFFAESVEQMPFLESIGFAQQSFDAVARRCAFYKASADGKEHHGFGSRAWRRHVKERLQIGHLNFSSGLKEGCLWRADDGEFRFF
jgi:hypothetical protein